LGGIALSQRKAIDYAVDSEMEPRDRGCVAGLSCEDESEKGEKQRTGISWGLINGLPNNGVVAPPLKRD